MPRIYEKSWLNNKKCKHTFITKLIRYIFIRIQLFKIKTLNKKSIQLFPCMYLLIASSWLTVHPFTIPFTIQFNNAQGSYWTPFMVWCWRIFCIIPFIADQSHRARDRKYCITGPQQSRNCRLSLNIIRTKIAIYGLSDQQSDICTQQRCLCRREVN